MATPQVWSAASHSLSFDDMAVLRQLINQRSRQMFAFQHYFVNVSTTSLNNVVRFLLNCQVFTELSGFY